MNNYIKHSGSIKVKCLFFVVVFILNSLLLYSVYNTTILIAIGISVFFICLSLFYLYLYYLLTKSYRFSEESITIKEINNREQDYYFTDLISVKYFRFMNIDAYNFLFNTKNIVIALTNDKMKSLFCEILNHLEKDFTKKKVYEFENSKRLIQIPAKNKINIIIIDLFCLLIGIVFGVPFPSFTIINIFGLLCCAITIPYIIYHLKMFYSKQQVAFIDKIGLSVNNIYFSWEEIVLITKKNIPLKGWVVIFTIKNNISYSFPIGFMYGDFIYENYLLSKIKKQHLTTAST